MYEAIFGSTMELERFCTTNVEVIDSEADQYSIIALHNIFGIPVTLFNLTNSPSEKVYILKVPEDGKSNVLKRGDNEDSDIRWMYNYCKI